MRSSQQAVYMYRYFDTGLRAENGDALQAIQLGSGQPTASLAPADTPIETGICSDPYARPTDVGLLYVVLWAPAGIFQGLANYRVWDRSPPTGVQGWSPGRCMGRSLQKLTTCFEYA